MIRFGAVASVVSVAVALLIVGALSGDLGLVYISIGLAALALVMLVIGVAVWRDQVFAGTTPASGRQVAADQHARAHPSASLAPAASAQAGLSQAGPVHAGPVHAGPVQAGRPAAAEDSRARTAAASGWPPRPAREPVAPQVSALAEHDLPAVRERPERTRGGRQPATGGQRPAAAGGPGRERETVSADWAGPEPSAAGWTGLAGAPPDRPGRAPGRTPRRQQGEEPHQVERAGAAEPPGRRPASTEPYPSVEQPEPADDPTRLAHRLGIGREASPEAESPSARPAEATAARRMRPDLAPESATERRSSADPLAGPRPASSSSSRTRKPGAGAAEAEAAATGSGPTALARPEGAAGPAAPERAPVGTPAGSPSSSPSAAADDGPAAHAADRATSGSAVTEAGQAGPAVTGGPPASSGARLAAAAGATESGTVESGTVESGTVESATPSHGDPSPPAAATVTGAASDGVQHSTQAVTQVLVVPGIARFHQADCILIRFLGDDDLQRISREEAEAAGCAACRACRP